MVSGEPLLNQSFVFWGKRRAVEFHSAMDEQLALLERQRGQFL